uniref:Uncharacterized protein n=1 Tax=Anguilla anguilla TaxID=7936 RepID=A0A0E9RJI1_ANGAN
MHRKVCDDIISIIPFLLNSAEYFLNFFDVYGQFPSSSLTRASTSHCRQLH